MSTPYVEAFDEWIRFRFVELNTKLEVLYSEQDDRANVEGIGDIEKRQLEQEGRAFLINLLAEGNTNEGFDKAFDLLGNVGLYMAACRRHELTEPSRETSSPLREASALALHIGSSLGVAPRFATAHLTTHNRAHRGVYKRFTTLADEKLFVDYNTKGILSYKRAAEALIKIQFLGVSHPIAVDLFENAASALQDVINSNATLFTELKSDEFFYAVRPYYKPHRVGSQIYRGANAGDFAGINVIDLLLGLCFANEISYSQILMDKFLFMMPDDQSTLKNIMHLPNLMDDFLDSMEFKNEAWYQTNLKKFLEVCELHGKTAIQHHDQLVHKYIAQPSATVEKKHLSNITASGPPLPVLLNSLEILRDKRAAKARDDIRTRFEDVKKLKGTLK